MMQLRETQGRFIRFWLCLVLSGVYMAASEAIGRDMLLKGQCIGQVRAVMAFASISWVVVQSQQSSVWTHDTNIKLFSSGT